MASISGNQCQTVGPFAAAAKAVRPRRWAAASSWETLVIAALATGFGNMLFNTLWETSLQQHVPAKSLSRVSAYDWFGALLCEPLGLALAGVTAAAIGMTQTLWIAAAVEGVAIAALLAAPSIRRLRRPDQTFEQVA
jgi:MFS family permease